MFAKPQAGMMAGEKRQSRRPHRGAAVVLTADATLTAGYATLFDAMAASSQTTLTPAPLLRLLAPRPTARRAAAAWPLPLGLRRIEAVLTAAGIEVAAVPPEFLQFTVGPDTRVIGVSSADPLGLGMNSTTMAAILPGRIHSALAFEKLLHRLRRLAGPRARCLAGGAGAWQLAAHPERAHALGIDHVVTGACEGNIAEIIGRLLNGSTLPFVVPGLPVNAAAVPPILGAATAGVIEISRGCGLGCRFCALRNLPMQHLPEATILADAATNLAAGAQALAISSEDLFRFGGTRERPAPSRLIALLERLRRLAGPRLLQADHVNICSVARLTDQELVEIRRLLACPGQEFVWLNIGLETTNGALLKQNGGGPKMAPFSPEEWPDAAREQILRLVRAGFLPLISVVLGLPGETPEDIETLVRWIRELRNERLTVFPLLYAPAAPGEPPPGPMNRARWRLFQLCYDLNFRWIPAMVAEQERLGGAPARRRLAVQLLGRAHILFWKARFRRFIRTTPE